MSLSNPWFIAAVLGIAGVFHLDLLVTFLNVARLGRPLPSALADIYTPEMRERAAAYIRDEARFDVIRSSFFLTLLVVFWWSGGFAWLQGVCITLTREPLMQSLLALVFVAVAQTLLNLPFDAWSTFKIEAAHGFNRTTLGTFITDHFKSLALMAVLGLPIAAAIIWFFQTQTLAALYAWAAVALFSILMTWLGPRLLMPLFLKFQPLPEGPLRESIFELAGRLQFPVTEVSIVDGSRRSTKANAFFAGFGKLRRIALFDTLVEKHTPDEILAVLAHEIGHNKRRHVPVRLAAAVLELGLLFGLLQWALHTPEFYAAFGITVTPQTALPVGIGLTLFGLIYKPLGLIIHLLGQALSRKHEFEADAFAAQALGSASPLASGLKRLSTDHLAHPDPHPLAVWLHYSHPPLAQRLQALHLAS